MTRNPIGLLEIALEIASAKTTDDHYGCDGGDCSCGEGDGCLATGWENFVPQPKQPAQTKHHARKHKNNRPRFRTRADELNQMPSKVAKVPR